MSTMLSGPVCLATSKCPRQGGELLTVCGHPRSQRLATAVWWDVTCPDCRDLGTQLAFPDQLGTVLGATLAERVANDIDEILTRRGW